MGMELGPMRQSVFPSLVTIPAKSNSVCWEIFANKGIIFCASFLSRADRNTGPNVVMLRATFTPLVRLR